MTRQTLAALASLSAFGAPAKAGEALCARNDTRIPVYATLAGVSAQGWQTAAEGVVAPGQTLCRPIPDGLGVRVQARFIDRGSNFCSRQMTMFGRTDIVLTGSRSNASCDPRRL